MRATAALLVLLWHWRLMFFVDRSQVPAHKLFWELPYTIGEVGHQSVIIFFVLSGYLIGGSVLRKVKRKSWSWREYLLHRVTRLWIVLIPALFLCALWDSIGIHSHAATLLYHGAKYVGNHETPDVIKNHKVLYFFSNMFFLQGTVTPTFGSDGPLWSLACEFWYYMLFPCALIAILSGSALRSRIAHATAFIVMAVLLSLPMFPLQIMVLFPCWLAGAALAFFDLPEVPARFRPWVILAYIPLFFFFGKAYFIIQPLSDYLLTLATMVLMITLLSYRSEARESVWTRASRRSAGFSYTLYLVHFPFLTLLAAFIVHNRRWQPTAAHVTIALAIMLSAIIYAYLIASVSEFHTARVREFVANKLARFFVPTGEVSKVAD